MKKEKVVIKNYNDNINKYLEFLRKVKTGEIKNTYKKENRH